MSWLLDRFLGWNMYFLIERKSWSPDGAAIYGPWDTKKDAKQRQRELNAQGLRPTLVKAVF